jgi:TonB-dependent receptor
MGKAVWGSWELIGGARVDHARLSSDIYEAIELEGSAPQLNRITSGAEYTNLLPRFQLNFRASEDTVFRSAIYTSIARPEPILMSGAIEIEEDDGEVDITYGNPELKPAYAWNFDLGVERYFGSIGLVSANVYYKHIDRFIFTEAAPEGEGDVARFANDPRLAGRDIDDVETYTNGRSAKIYGVELNFVRQFSELPGLWSGFGVYANATFQKSSADTGVEDLGRIDFFNAPEKLYTAALTYQNRRMEGSIAYSWRDRQTAEFSTYLTQVVEEPFGSLDGQVRVNFGPAVSAFLNFVDILNDGKDAATDRRYGSGTNYLFDTSFTGRTLTLGVDVRF